MRTGEKGFSLIVMLFFVGMVAGMMATIISRDSGDVQRDQAREAGWHLVQIAKAARVYVRDNDGYTVAALQNNPQTISVETLRDAGLLPSSFPEINILNQSVSIYVANYPYTDPDPDNAYDQVPGAFVFLRDTAETRQAPILMQHVIEGARKYGLSADAPVFNASGSASTDCDGNGQNDVVLWSGGCLDESEFLQIVAADSDEISSFVPGSLMVPAWRAQEHDSRIVSRYPHADNPSYATMTTALEMGQPVVDAGGSCAEFVQINNYTDGTLVDTDLCAVEDDTGNSDWQDNDLRYDIHSARIVQTQRLIAARQGEEATGYNEVSVRFDDEGNATETGNDSPPFGMSHNLVVQAATIQADGGQIRLTGLDANPTAGEPPSSYVPRLGFMDDPDPDAPDTIPTRRDIQVNGNFSVTGDMAVAGQAHVNAATVSVFDQSAAGSAASVAGTINSPILEANSVSASGVMASTALNVGSGGGVGNSLGADDAVVLGNVQTNTLDVNGAGQAGGIPAMIIYKMDGGGDITVGSSLLLDKSLVMGGEVQSQSTTSMENCIGAVGSACPNITRDPEDGDPEPPIEGGV